GHSYLNRRGFPPQLKQQRLAHLESRYYMSSDDKTFCTSKCLHPSCADCRSKYKKDSADIQACSVESADIRNTENTAAEPQTPARQRKPVTAVPSARLNDTRHIIVAHKNDLQCVHCSKPSAPKRTKFYCSGCPNHPHLHPVCFAPYHSSV
ncbi:hypothetical protein RRG08_041227, partial [Elysia crispata]